MSSPQSQIMDGYWGNVMAELCIAKILYGCAKLCG